MKFLFVMDPWETLNLETETSLLLMEELIQRGHQVFWLEQQDVALIQGSVEGKVGRVNSVTPFMRSAPVWADLDRFDALLLRKDPPFDTDYLQLTLLLDHLDSRVVQFNEVKSLRDFNEKLLPMRWPQLTPKTLVSMDRQRIVEFVVEQDQVVLKPLNDCSGRGIKVIKADENGDFQDQISVALKTEDGSPRFLLAQQYLPQVSTGDKRIYLVDGESVGMVNRLPRDETSLANIHQGAICEATRLSADERRAIETISPFLRAQGLFLVGADFIGGKLTELNITSPSAVRQINAVSGEQVQGRIVDAMLNQIRETRANAQVSATAELCCLEAQWVSDLQACCRLAS